MQCLLGSALNVLDKSRTRIPTLDGWRGVAILMVLLSHTGIALRGVLTIPHAESIGQHGVAIFFVLSGYLITSRLMQEEEAFGSVSLGSFYIRRFFRLMPCAWTFMLFAFVLTLGAHPRPFTGKDVVASLCFFRNYVETNGAHPITGHFWSLSIEEQFYLVWPSVLIFCGTRWARWAAVAGAAGVALYRLHAWTFLAHQPLQATFGTQYRADALLTGCAGALFLPLLRPYLRSWMIVPLLGSLA